MSDSPDEPSQDARFEMAGWSTPAGLDDAALETIGQTVQHAAGAIDGLKDILGRLQYSVVEATEQRRNDIEIGLLFTRAQEFVEGAVTEGHELAQRIVADAEFEAVQIITAAKAEAHRLIEEGRDSGSLPSEAVIALQTTIEDFSQMNSALVQELSAVKEALVSHGRRRPAVSQPLPSQGLPRLQVDGIAVGSPTERGSGPEAQLSDRSPTLGLIASPGGGWTTPPWRGPATGGVGGNGASGAR